MKFLANYKIQPRILGGRLGEIRNHRWLVSLREVGVHVCGAVLITPDKVLTAGHCYNADIAARSYSVYAGSNSRISDGELAKVRRIYMHPGFRFDKMEDDLALVWLLKNLTVGTFIHPIPMADLNEVLPGGVLAKAGGWGHQPSNYPHIIGDYPKNFYETDMPILSSEDCAKVYGKSINTKLFICGGYQGEGPEVTGGDSGGPLVYNNKVYGLVSWSSFSGNSRYVTAFTRIAAYRDWIDEAMTEEYLPMYNDGW